MFSETYEYGEIVVRINFINEYFKRFSQKYVSDKNAKYEITISQEDIDNERKRNDDTFENEIFPDFYLETLVIYRKFLDVAWKENVFLFHSSTFAIDDTAFILTAPSGTGKSTHARFLKQVYGDKFKIINDDKPLVRFDGKDFFIYGTPWNGKHNLDNNVKVKLGGMFVLYQNKENVIKKLSSSETFNYIFKQIHRPLGKEAMSVVLNLSIKMSNLPCYYFGCTNSVDSTNVSKEIIESILNK